MSGVAEIAVTSGRGPAECRRAVVMTCREIEKEALEAGLSVSCDLLPDEDEAASATVFVGGKGAEAFAARLEGTVLWVFRGETRGRNSRRNWFVGVRRIASAEEPVKVKASDVRYEATRGSGPGGQHRNVTDSAVRAVHLPTGMAATAADGRSQHANRKTAFARLCEAVAAREQAGEERRRRNEWMDRIAVERGSPVRTWRA